MCVGPILLYDTAHVHVSLIPTIDLRRLTSIVLSRLLLNLREATSSSVALDCSDYGGSASISLTFSSMIFAGGTNTGQFRYC